MKTLSICILFTAAGSMALQEMKLQNWKLTVENDPDCHFEGTITFSKLRAYLRDPRFIECCRRKDAEEEEKEEEEEESANRVKPEPEITTIRPTPKPWDLDDPMEDNAEDNAEGNSVQRLEDLKQDIINYGAQLSACYYDNGELNIEKYFQMRQKIFDVKRQIQDFQSRSDEKALVEKKLHKLLVWVKMEELMAEETLKTTTLTTAIQSTTVL